jgi:Rps23 Pro-64 3,4-dihydroxylase Tpa1-like proline 4-hydroxylase
MSLTKNVLHQKRLCVKNGIPLYLPTPKEMSQDSINASLAGVDADLKRISEEIAFAQKESDQYRGGAIKVLLEIKIATMKLSESVLQQKKVCLANGLPVYLPTTSSGSSDTEKRIPMKGSILDNL